MTHLIPTAAVAPVAPVALVAPHFLNSPTRPLSSPAADELTWQFTRVLASLV